jgi:spermidine synthase
VGPECVLAKCLAPAPWRRTEERWMTNRIPYILGGLVVLALVGLLLWVRPGEGPLTSDAQASAGRGILETDVKSEYSRIRVRRVDNTRTLWFVRDSGEEVVESIVNLDRPHELLVEYTRYMFLSYLFRPKQEKVLIVGLGGGAMVHFLQHYEPKVHVDVVEIDPVIVRIADKYFNVRSNDMVNIITADGFDYLKNTESKYDVIYMDAFLKPSSDTDETGVPVRLKTLRFYKEIQSKLTPGGMVVFNINPNPLQEKDVKTIAEGFPQAYVFDLPRSEGLVVVGSMVEKRATFPELRESAIDTDRRFGARFSFRDMAAYLRRR